MARLWRDQSNGMGLLSFSLQFAAGSRRASKHSIQGAKNLLTSWPL